MSAPHHAGNVMPRQREPHRKVAADGARTENAYPHGVIILPREIESGSFHKLAPARNR